MPTLHHLLLADLADQLRVALPIIFFVLYGIAQLVSVLKQDKQKRVNQPRPRPEADPAAPQGWEKFEGAPPAADKPRGLEETLRKEVEEFLRRSQGQPNQPSGNRPATATKSRPPAPKKPRPVEEPEAPTRRLVESSRRTSPTTAQSSRDAERGGLPTGAAVDSYVSEQMRGVKSIAQQAEELGDDVALADERMEAHLHSRFDHKLGTLVPEASVISKAVSQANASTKEFRELLTRPGGMRQVIIANEILRRPEERWEL